MFHIEKVPTILTSILTFCFMTALLYDRWAFVWVVAFSAVVSLVLWLAITRGKRARGSLIHLDQFAQKSRLISWNTGLKVLVCGTVLLLCVACDSLFVAGMILLCMTVVNVTTSKAKLTEYFALLTVPVSFVLLSGIVLLVSVSPHPLGTLDIPVFGWYLCVTPQSQARTLLVIMKALGSVSCLYALSLSTPMYEITSLLRRIHVPAIVVELMVLIYRYIFILIESMNAMMAAAHSRLGYRTYRCTWRSFGGIASNLLVRSFVQAGRSFDAMEARGYSGEIRFLERRKPLTISSSLLSVGLIVLPCTVFIMERGLG